MRFSRHFRLLRGAEFQRVFKQAMRSSDDCFRILARPGEEHENEEHENRAGRHRMGMAVSRKACATAVGRNRIKRVVRESFRSQLVGITPPTALDFVILPTAVAKNRSNAALSDSLDAHWRRLIRKAEQTAQAVQLRPPRPTKD